MRDTKIKQITPNKATTKESLKTRTIYLLLKLNCFFMYHKNICFFFSASMLCFESLKYLLRTTTKSFSEADLSTAVPHKKVRGLRIEEANVHNFTFDRVKWH